MNSPTAAGRVRPKPRAGAELVDAINQVFALFRVNYHNQYYKAFPDTETLNITKKLWLESLRDLPERAILKAAEQLVRSQDYLPTLSQMLRAVRALADESLPDLRAAFIEACQAPPPKRNHPWSHPLVYHAGQLTGWHTLATQPERYSFPLFRKYFEQLEQSHFAGKPLALPDPQPDETSAREQPVDSKDARRCLAALRAQLKI